MEQLLCCLPLLIFLLQFLFGCPPLLLLLREPLLGFLQLLRLGLEPLFGCIPLRRASSDEEEERRLLYVAMTRAREQLTMYWPIKDRSHKNNRLSAFLRVLKKSTKDPLARRPQNTAIPQPATAIPQAPLFFEEPDDLQEDTFEENSFVEEPFDNGEEEPPDNDLVYVYDVDEW